MLQTAPPGPAAGAGADSGAVWKENETSQRFRRAESWNRLVEPGWESQNSAEVVAGVAGQVGSSRTPASEI